MNTASLKGKIATILFLNLFICTAHADYQHELSYLTESADFDSNTDYSYNALGYAYYVNPLSVDNKPLAEAVFLQRSSVIEVGYFDFEYKFPSTNKATGDGVGVEYTMLDPASPFMFGIGYETFSGANKTSSGLKNFGFDSTKYNFSLGWFMNQATLVYVGVAKTKFEYEPPYSNSSFDTTDIFLVAKSVRDMGGGTALNIEGLFGRNDHRDGTNTVYGVYADYYFTNRMSLGGFYFIESGNSEEDEGKTTGLQGKVFFTPSVWLEIQLTSFDAEGDSYDEMDIELGLRF